MKIIKASLAVVVVILLIVVAAGYYLAASQGVPRSYWEGYKLAKVDYDDAGIPTNRKTKTTYTPGQTFVTTIDFYLISPNVKVRKVRTVDTGFAYSDHQPVWMEVELLK